MARKRKPGRFADITARILLASWVDERTADRSTTRGDLAGAFGMTHQQLDHLTSGRRLATIEQAFAIEEVTISVKAHLWRKSVVAA